MSKSGFLTKWQVIDILLTGPYLGGGLTGSTPPPPEMLEFFFSFDKSKKNNYCYYCSNVDLWPSELKMAQLLLLLWDMLSPVLVFLWFYFCFRVRTGTGQTVGQTDRRTRLVIRPISARGIRAPWPGFESRFAPLFQVAILGKLFTHIASPVSQLQETVEQKGSFRRLSGYGD